MFVQKHAAGHVGVVVVAAGGLGDRHDAAAGGAAAGGAKGLVAFVDVVALEQVGAHQIADVDRRRYRPDGLDLQRVADHQGLFGQGEGWRGDLGEHLTGLIDDQQVDEVERVVIDVVLAGAFHLFGQHEKRRDHAGGQLHPALPVFDQRLAPVPAAAVDDVLQRIADLQQPATFPVMGGQQEDIEAQRNVGPRVAVAQADGHSGRVGRARQRREAGVPIGNALLFGLQQLQCALNPRVEGLLVFGDVGDGQAQLALDLGDAAGVLQGRVVALIKLQLGQAQAFVGHGRQPAEQGVQQRLVGQVAFERLLAGLRLQ